MNDWQSVKGNRLDGGPRVRYDGPVPRGLTEAGPVRRVRLVETTGDIVRLAEYNHYHDEHGRFAPGGGGRLDNSSLASKVAGPLDTEGGASVALGGGSPTEGYMVAYAAGDGHSLVLPATMTKAERDAAVAAWVKDQRAFVASHPEHYFGSWKDEAGAVYLDVSQRFHPNDREAAIKAGQDRNQKAIFDLSTFTEIDTGGTGT